MQLATEHDWQETGESGRCYLDYVCLQCGAQKLVYQQQQTYYYDADENPLQMEPECN